MDDLVSKREGIADRLLLQKKNKVFSDWYTAIRDKADIQDFRDQYYK